MCSSRVNKYSCIKLIRERKRRHKLVREHGLIMLNRTKSWISRYRTFQNPTRTNAGRFEALMQLSSGINFDRMLEGLQYELDLKKFLLKFVFSFKFQINAHM